MSSICGARYLRCYYLEGGCLANRTKGEGFDQLIVLCVLLLAVVQSKPWQRGHTRLWKLV